MLFSTLLQNYSFSYKNNVFSINFEKSREGKTKSRKQEKKNFLWMRRKNYQQNQYLKQKEIDVNSLLKWLK